MDPLASEKAPPAENLSLRYRVVRKLGFLLRLRLEEKPGLPWRMAMALLAFLMRVHGWTIRTRIEDRAGYLAGRFPHPVIILFWHNRMFAVPAVSRRLLPRETRPKSVLTSASPEGSLLALVMAHFGLGAVRGSSSRRGPRALREMEARLRRGEDIVITPDGPRGPRYCLQPGPIALAHLTQVPILPVHLEYSSCWRFRSWDGFAVPRPFSSIQAVVGDLFWVRAGADADELEAERARLERIMRDALVMDGGEFRE